MPLESALAGFHSGDILDPLYLRACRAYYLISVRIFLLWLKKFNCMSRASTLVGGEDGHYDASVGGHEDIPRSLNVRPLLSNRSTITRVGSNGSLLGELDGAFATDRTQEIRTAPHYGSSSPGRAHLVALGIENPTS